MKRNNICIVLSFMFLITVFWSRKAYCMSEDVFPTSTATINSGQSGSFEQAEYMDESKFITSGIFVYRIIDETQREIEIRGINTSETKLAIP